MKKVRPILLGCYILVSVFLFLSLVGCEREYYRRDNVEYDRGYRHYYREGRWYRQDSLGHDIAVAALAVGALIDSLPPRHDVVVIDNTQYYHDGRYYYRQAPNSGYVVVRPSATVKAKFRGSRGDRGERGNDQRR